MSLAGGNHMEQGNRCDNQAVTGSAISSPFWKIVGMSISILISLQLLYPQFNFASVLSYGRLRPLHTKALIYTFTARAAFSLFFFLVRWLDRTPLAFLGSRSESC